jgi:hypothetical protein
MAHGEQARDDAFDVAVDRGCGLTKGDRCNGGGRIGADAGQRQEGRFGRGKLPAQIAHDHLGALM